MESPTVGCMLSTARAGHTPSIALLLFVMATFAVAGSLTALVAPRSELWWGNRNSPRPQWRMSATNMWMFNDKDGRTPSPAGVVLIRAVGCVLLVAAIALTVSAFKQL